MPNTLPPLEDQRIRHALATNLSDLLRYQNMLCRYDTMALKSLDIFSIHGFPVGLVQCESNFLGIQNGNGLGVGSGGWSNIIDKYTKAKRYCDEPFEVRRGDTSKKQIPIEGEWIGERLNGHRTRSVNIRCASSTTIGLPPASLDAVFTDPPYFGNVQYGELMDFCYVWLQRLVGKESEGFDRVSTRALEELTGNVTQGRDLEHFTDGLSAVYTNMAKALKPGARWCLLTTTTRSTPTGPLALQSSMPASFAMRRFRALRKWAAPSISTARALPLWTPCSFAARREPSATQFVPVRG